MRLEYTDTIRVALIDGVKREYYMCSSEEEMTPQKECFEYIGRGTIYSLDGVKQHDTALYHFWIKS